MIYTHQTATCPGCNKDSWASEWQAFFTGAKCTWCGCEFKWDNTTNTYKITKEGKYNDESKT